MLERELGEVDEMRTKETLLVRLPHLMYRFPYRSIERLYKFLSDSSVTGEITFAFHRGELIAWSNTLGAARHRPELDRARLGKAKEY